MKNATFKHHQVENKSGITDGKYQLTYTTSPDKSYVVKPDDGEINYEKYGNKASKLVDKIMNGGVERFELSETKSSPMKKKKRASKANSPVKIS